MRILQLGTGGNQGLAVLVALVLGEVLDEPASQIGSLGFPVGHIGVGVSGVKNCGINAGQLGGNLDRKSVV